MQVFSCQKMAAVGKRGEKCDRRKTPLKFAFSNLSLEKSMQEKIYPTQLSFLKNTTNST